MHRKTSFIFTFLFLLVSAGVFFFEIGDTQAQIDLNISVPSSNPEQNPGQADDYAEYFERIVRYGTGALGFILVATFMWAGFLRVTAAGDSGRIGLSTQLMYGSVIGAVLVLGAYTLLYIINPKLVEVGVPDFSEEVPESPWCVDYLVDMNQTILEDDEKWVVYVYNFKTQTFGTEYTKGSDQISCQIGEHIALRQKEVNKIKLAGKYDSLVGKTVPLDEVTYASCQGHWCGNDRVCWNRDLAFDNKELNLSRYSEDSSVDSDYLCVDAKSACADLVYDQALYIDFNQVAELKKSSAEKFGKNINELTARVQRAKFINKLNRLSMESVAGCSYSFSIDGENANVAFANSSVEAIIELGGVVPESYYPSIDNAYVNYFLGGYDLPVYRFVLASTYSYYWPALQDPDRPQLSETKCTNDENFTVANGRTSIRLPCESGLACRADTSCSNDSYAFLDKHVCAGVVEKERIFCQADQPAAGNDDYGSYDYISVPCAQYVNAPGTVFGGSGAATCSTACWMQVRSVVSSVCRN